MDIQLLIVIIIGIIVGIILLRKLCKFFFTKRDSSCCSYCSGCDIPVKKEKTDHSANPN